MPAGIKLDVGTNWVGPGGHVVHYPVRGGALLNFVGLLERDDWRVESWTVQGTKDEFANDFRNWNPDDPRHASAASTCPTNGRCSRARRCRPGPRGA